MDDSNLANALGALATRLTDLVQAAVAASGWDASSAAALVHVAKYPGAPIEGLRAPLALSHSGCVRLVDRLVADGLLERRAAGDARAVAVFPTRRGRAAAAEIRRRRDEVLARAVAALAPRDRVALGRILVTLLPRAVPTVPAALRTCRLSDEDACRACPVHAADG